VAFSLRGNAPADQKRGSVQMDPISVVKPWGESSPQFLNALWHGESLEVVFEFVQQDDTGKESVFETITLKNASVASVQRRVGNLEELVEQGTHRNLEEVGFRFESLEIKHKGKSQTVAKYDWRQREGR
jgi:type VI secretion system Hcp family effector